MPIDIEKVLGAEIPPVDARWNADKVILYHLGLGAGVPATDPAELQYTYEGDLKVLPSFAVIPLMGTIIGLFGLDGVNINLAMLLHGEQEIELHAPIPVKAEITTTATVTDILDKGKGAVVIVEARSATRDGEPLFTNRFSAYIRGEGGFGGPSGPPVGNQPPDRAPDHEVQCPTLEQQALLYRLCGDKNPLHADPSFAAKGGFDRPILHGLCSYGMACKAVVDTVLGGDVTRVAGYAARFAGVFFPGETMVVSMWVQGDRILLGARSKERDAPVLSNAVITVKESA
ncbi:MAG TPA: MaoC/PaaZ C-terminal domain-containing protein [Solirubrobacteraceae bacterium]|jgi:acyl dehydratase|nr:MaoC/PaaZ C-terminal domain-containing protein [Solirubrobacteraceae bacterium]